MPTVAVPDILSQEFSDDPFPVLADMRENHPLLFHEATNSYILSRYEDVEKAFKDPGFTSDNYSWQLEPVHGPTILQMEGREHTRHRGLVTPAFRGSELREKFVPVIAQNSADLIDAFRDDGEVDFVDQYTTRFPINVIVDMLGLPKSDHSRFHAWYSSIMEFLSNLTGDTDVMAAGIRTKDELEAYMMPIIAERRTAPGEDLLTTLCQAEIDGQHLSDLEVKAFVSLLLTAGGETTDKSMANMFWRLIENPEQMEAVRADRSLIRNAFAETLRHTPPVQMIMRETAEDVEVSGGTIPAGKTVTCLLAGANRDPSHYEDPDRFDIFREDLDMKKAFTAAANHTSFAFGRHFCVGAVLALTEVEIGTNQLLDAMDDIAFANGSPEAVGVFTRSPVTMPLKFTPAK